jgi:putative ABC transport system substrate-binding protein
VELGLVTSLNRPEGNMTGVSFLITATAGKRLELLRELIPTATQIGYLVNPDSFNNEIKDVKAAGRALGLQILVLNARGERDFDQAFATLIEQRASALFGWRRSAFSLPPRRVGRAGGAVCDSRDLLSAPVRYRRRIDQLRHQH